MNSKIILMRSPHRLLSTHAAVRRSSTRRRPECSSSRPRAPHGGPGSPAQWPSSQQVPSLACHLSWPGRSCFRSLQGCPSQGCWSPRAQPCWNRRASGAGLLLLLISSQAGGPRSGLDRVSKALGGDCTASRSEVKRTEYKQVGRSAPPLRLPVLGRAASAWHRAQAAQGGDANLAYWQHGWLGRAQISALIASLEGNRSWRTTTCLPLPPGPRLGPS